MSDLSPQYVLVTAAYNEERYIERTIQSVVAQTLVPQRWVVVSDGSTDHTDEIVETYAVKYPFIQLLRRREEHARNFAAQVQAINFGCSYLQDVSYHFIANLDADLSFEPTYYSDLLHKFESELNLGLAGGFICEVRHGRFESRTTNRKYSVAHAVQMFRRECFEAIGGYLALPYGGPDWHAQVMARMLGWHVVAFPELRVMHHRPSGTAGRYMNALFREGRMDYSLGSDPTFEIFKLVRRFALKPYVLGSLVRLSGFLWGYLRRETRPVSLEFVRYLRNDQMRMILKVFSDAFHKTIPEETKSQRA